ncbi:MAG: prolipoprotein diacylglyceryl transferase [Bacteroidales bacterium]|nr:prolipoprotein diacylglyceryl transferase [Bacteroidales bacterium]
MYATVIIINRPESYNSFMFFYQLAFCIPFLILLFIGIRRKYNMYRWLTIMMVASFFFLLGTRFSTFTITDWSALLSNGTWPGTTHKFALGGLIFAFAGVLLAKKLLKFNKAVLRLYSWVLPLGLAIQKLGCLFSGCCFGRVTEMPWGIRYAAGTVPYYDHFVSGLISRGAETSLPVHPVQIYQIIAYLAIVFIVIFFRTRLRNPRSIVFLSLGLLFLFRFLIEGFIDHQATIFGGNIYAGLKVIQWLCLIITIFIAVFFLRSERRLSEPEREVGPNASRLVPLFLMVFITLTFILLRNVFTKVELIAFNIRFLLISCLMLVFTLNEISVPRLRLATGFIILLPLLLLSQTLPQEGDDFITKHKIMGSATLGHYYNQIRYNPHEGSCGTTYDRIAYENKYFSMGAAYSVTGRKDFQNYEYGGFLTGAYITEREISTNISKNIPLVVASPFAEYNWHWLGLGAILNIGYVPYLPLQPYDSYIVPDKNHKITPLMPGFMARVGPYNWFDARLKFSYGFPQALPTKLWDISLGTGFGMKTGSGIRIGTTLPLEESYYFEGKYFFNDRFILSTTYLFGRNYFIEGTTNNEFTLGFGYLFDKN